MDGRLIFVYFRKFRSSYSERKILKCSEKPKSSRLPGYSSSGFVGVAPKRKVPERRRVLLRQIPEHQYYSDNATALTYSFV